MDYDPNEQTAKDMAEARRRTSFNVHIVRNIIWNGQEEWEQHSALVKVLSKDPVFDKTIRDTLTRTARFNHGLAMLKRLVELEDEHQWSQREAVKALSLIDEGTAMTLHSVAFVPPLLSQGSAEMVSTFGILALNRGILGAYAQTELGHGTNVASLETTAHYIPETQEFEIHSPTLTSTKWWIGGSGRVATHALVQARLILPLSSKQDYGPHLFLVQLRSLADHKPMPGITIGDIGSKAFGAFAANDNGFIRFNQVRIPRTSMLSKFSGVTPTGEYVKPPHAKLSYGGMLFIRSGMITSAGWQLAKAIGIAVRYASVRRQGGMPGNEQRIIEYPTVHYRLLPILAQAYVFIMLGREVTTSFQSMNAKLADGDTSLLAETHAILSALKVLVSTNSVHSIEVARRCLGGHGFSAAAGLGRLYAEHVPSTTYEGDNFVLDQQVFRAALKALNSFQAGLSETDLPPSSRYLRWLRMPSIQECSWTTFDDCIGLLERRAASMVISASGAQEDTNVMQRVSRAVADAFVAAQVGSMCEGLRRKCSGIEREVLSNLLKLVRYLLSNIEAALVDILSFGILQIKVKGEDPSLPLRSDIARLCCKILPDAIGLTDAFGFTDWELNSALGVESGRVYEALWSQAQLEPLNEQQVAEGYEAHIKPILERGQRLSRGAKL